jgi:translation initiation factor 2 subunit 2
LADCVANAKDDYLALLAKARGALPENVGNRTRWSLPEPELIAEGRMTILRNLREIVQAMRREDSHVVKFLLTQLATAGNQDGDRVVFVGRINEENVRARLDDYVATYVQCSECGSPDTHLERQDRIQVLKCEACGAHHPVKARKAQRKTGDQSIREGAQFEITVQRQGKRGEGIATREGFTIVVPQTAKGQTVKVKITRIQGDLAFAELVK